MKKLSVLFPILLGLMLLTAGLASAHVTVYPKETTQGSYEVFTVRVPSEKADTSTIKVEVKFPAEVSISRVEPKAGWKYELTKQGTTVTGVIWTAESAGLSPTEFTEFRVNGKVADTATAITWKAYQTYKDNSVVEWTGAADSKTPASVTSVKAKPAGSATDSHGHTQTSGDHATTSSSSNLATYLSGAALLLAVIAVILAARKRK